MDGVVTFLIAAALVFGLFVALTIFAKELVGYVRSRTKARARKTAAPSPHAKPRRTDGEHAAGARGDSALTHDALHAGHASAAATHAAGDTSGAGEPSSASWGEAGGGYESSSSDGGGDYGGGDFGGGGGGGGWS